MAKATNYNSVLISGLLSEISAEEQEKTDKRMRLAARIERGIKAKGWKKSDFALAMKKQPSVISRWLSGTNNFESDTLFDIEKVLNIKLVALYDEPKLQVLNFYLSVSETVSTLKNPVHSWVPMDLTSKTRGIIHQDFVPNKKIESHNFEYQS